MDEQEIDQVGDTHNFAQLRQKADEATARADAIASQLAAARSELATAAVKLGGFDPEHGVTKLLMKDYLASLGDEGLPSVDSLLEHAKTLGVEPSAPVSSNGASVKEELDRLQSVGEELRQQATIPEPVDDIHTRLAKAEADGDVQTSMALKAQILRGKAA